MTCRSPSRLGPGCLSRVNRDRVEPTGMRTIVLAQHNHNSTTQERVNSNFQLY
jgi:hypothetical protein